jgi:hypothetical protein
MGKNGVAAHLADLSPYAPKCLRTEVDGEVRNWQHHFIPHPQAATVSRIEERRRKA